MITKKIFIVACCLLLWASVTRAQVNRPYEPIVLIGDSLAISDSLAQFFNYEIQYLYLYAYNATLDSWKMIPFQIDEVNPKVEDSLKYFVPEDSLRGFFDGNDELVFMLDDLGDQADSTSWLEGTDSVRYEICFIDSLTNGMSYVYLYSSRAVTEKVPSPYGMAYDSLTDRITTANYEVGFNETGQLADVIIGGSGIDIFDRLKVRLMGSYWILPPAEIYENNVKMYYAYAKVGPVRVIRNMHGLITFEYFDVYKDEAEFTQTSFFYPWHGVFTLFGIPIKKLANIIEIDGFRVSWDFNRNAEGMTFYNEFNKNGVIINGEGRTDDIDRSCFPDELNWNLGTGDIGTILNIFHVPPLGDNIRTYYFDDTTGTTGDDEGKKIDTGDKMSFGDNGFSLEKNLEDDAKKEDTLKVEYYNFFLPPNFNSDDASLICEQLKEPLNYETRIQKLPRPSGVAKSPDFVPNDFELYQNYPNPFNAATTIAFALPRKTPVALRIYDTLGRMVATLVDRTLPQGIHHYIWQGRDEQGWSIPTGLYIYKLETAEFNSTKKLLLIK